MLYRLLTLYDNKEADTVNIITTSVDQIPAIDLRNSRKMKLGLTEVTVPDHLPEYLRHHYGPGLKKIPPKEMQVNHAPLTLSFGE